MSRQDLEITLAVGLGGALGALTRWGIEEWGSVAQDSFPWPTLLANVAGALLMGLVLGRLAHLGEEYARLVPFVTTGFLGGLTTFSTFAVETVLLLDRGRGALALAYVVSTLVLGLLAVWLGMRAATTREGL